MSAGAVPPTPEALRDLAARAASATAELLRAGLERPRVVVETKSSATDLVTEVDRRAEERLVELLLGARPDDGLVGEEGHDVAGTTGVRWVVDPIDGTTNYLYGHPGFAVSVAAEQDGRPVAAAVADPLHADLYTAALGAGASRNGVRLDPPPAPALDRLLVGTGFSYLPERRRAQAEVLVRLLPRVRDVRRMGAAAVDLCSVGAGRLDAFYERGLQPWDLAAGALVAAEAGRRVEALAGADGLGDLLLAAPPERFDELAALLVEAGADAA